MAAKFPKRREDGTFSVGVVFTSSAPLEHGEVERWLKEWVTSNAEWIREWQGAEGKVVQTDTLRLAEAFQQEPRLVSSTAGEYVIRLDGTSAAPFWKDWMVKLTGEVTSRFPTLTFRKAIDC